MPQSYVKRILNARIYDLVVETPVDEAAQLSERLGNRVLLKREDLQPVFSFKLRGAYNKMLCLSEEQLQKGVVAASAGNHAQGLAMAAKKMGVKATIVMPSTTPQIKVNAVKARGARVVLHGDTYDEASDYAQKLVVEKGMTYVHPFDDPEVIAGQGTIAMEILRQVSGDLDAVFIPVGGGGLCAGMAAYIKYVRPEIKVIAVEPDDAACLAAAMEKGRRVRLKHVGIFADGTAVAQIGKETFRVLKDTVDAVVTVNADEISAAIKDIFDDTRSICEPSGALGVAGLKKYVEQHGIQGQSLLAVDSGANINFDRLRYISERTEIGERREAILAVTIPEKPGSFKAFCSALSKRNITEFNYRMGDPEQAHIFVGVQVTGDEDREQLVADLVAKGYPLSDMTDNEMAKLHIRHMVGGRAPEAIDEVVYRFEFPERPGALMNFLNQLGGRWNISMFHYRNHGSAYGRVLAGMQVPAGEHKSVKQFLDDLGYVWVEETSNPAYKFFLS
ncbi:MAG: threonine ammonia-lyase, biosynthetic [Gammaproteobacteria bacterium]|nr:MAG: threonine ammonia-lyase, biosynthetic [Gammaproteobacteria bacterium]